MISIVLRAGSFGMSAALIVGLLKLVDSNHQEPAHVVIGYMAATALWLAIVAALWMLIRRRCWGSQR